MQQPYPSYPPPPPAPKPSSNRTLWIILGSLGGLIIVCCIIAGIALAVNGSGSPGAAAGAPTATPADTPLPTATPKPKKWVVAHTFRGNGNQKTASFTINADDWRLIWTCTPASFYGGQYNVVVSVDESDGSFGGDPAAINTICQAGNTTGTTEEHNVTGSLFLDVVSEGAWTIKVEVFE